MDKHTHRRTQPSALSLCYKVDKSPVLTYNALQIFFLSLNKVTYCPRQRLTSVSFIHAYNHIKRDVDLHRRCPAS